MKLIYSLLFLALVAIYLAEPEITFKPFSLKFNNWIYSIGWVLIIAGLTAISVAKYMQGQKETLNEVIKIVEKIKKDKESDH